MDKSDLPTQKLRDNVRQKPKRVSRFAKKMARKRSNLDRKLSKMKSKLRDVEQRKEAFASKKNDDSKHEERVQEVEASADVDHKDADKKDLSRAANEPHAVGEEIKTEELAQSVDVSATQAKSNLKGDGNDAQQHSDKLIGEEPVKEKEPGSSAESKNAAASAQAAIVARSKNSIFNSDKDHKSVPKLRDEKPSQTANANRKVPASAEQTTTTRSPSRSKPASVALTKPKSKGSVALSGGLGARGAKKTKPDVLLRKIIDRLDESSELKFISPYRDEFLGLLRNLHQHKICLSWCTHQGPELREGEGLPFTFSDQASIENTRQVGADKEGDIHTGKIERYIRAEVVGTLYAFSWDSLLRLSPAETGHVRQSSDIHIIQELPDKARQHQFLPMLERLSRESGALLLAPENLRGEIERMQHEFAINRGYSVIDPTRLTYVEVECRADSIEWLDMMLDAEDVAESIKDFSLHRHIMRIAQTLEAKCAQELTKLALVNELKSLKPIKKENTISVMELDALMKSTVSSTKLLLGAKGIEIDELGQINFASELNELESAQALVSELSTEDMVREDELDALKFGAAQRKSIDRIKRFRFASKLGYLWKLKPEYIEHLHQGTSDVILEHAKRLYKQTSRIVDKHLKQMSKFSEGLEKNSEEFNSFKRFISAWRSEQHLTEAISKVSDLNHFRSSIFSKKGNAAPVEAQSGVLKELRESRMFVSQLMAFGMLGAVLLGSTYAVDVFVVWLSGEVIDLGDSLVQAAKSSRGLGRQVRILIAGVAGICIVFYLLLRLYLRSSEKVLDQRRIADVYALQLEDVVSKFIAESSAVTKEIIAADLDRLQLRFGEFRSALPEDLKNTSRSRDREGIGSTSIGQAEPAKRIETLRKWLNSVMSERDNISIVQPQKAAFDEAQQHFKS